jgi:hypothetical protein
MVRHRMSEGGYRETRDRRRWLWWDTYHVVMLRHWMSGACYGETLI